MLTLAWWLASPEELEQVNRTIEIHGLADEVDRIIDECVVHAVSDDSNLAAAAGESEHRPADDGGHMPIEEPTLHQDYGTVSDERP